ncbi:restriction endonuclease subunit S [Staphylococcus equorum]|uniref:restriction endonuclease subunit S n=1 Tax=Staphylococcus equorum TaxID=246432 RepID=UPI0008FAF10E|nr:restriction endonuclease subunit S [Staphylococcus equorum]OIS57464.1 hypothetical protein A4A34_10435 [Staphylococcus equorum]
MSREMKDSKIQWIGEIPQEWEIIKNKYIFKRRNNKVAEKYIDYQLLSLTKKGIVKKDVNETGGKLPASFSTYQEVQKDDIVLCLFDLDVSAVFSGISKYPGMISSAYDVFKTNQESVPDYYDYLFQAIGFDRLYLPFSKSLRKTINEENFNSIFSIKPPLNEQLKIVDFLHKSTMNINNIIVQTQKSIEELKKYKQSLITEAVTKGLDPNVEMKDSGIDWIGDIPKHWNIKKIKYTTSTIDTKKDFVKEDIYIGLENVLSYEGRINDYGKLVTDSKEKYFEKGNILYSKLRPYLAKAFIADITGGCSGEFIVFESFKGNKRYLLYWLISQLFTDFINATSYGAKMPRSSWDYIKETSIPRPPKHEENEIVSYLDDKSSQINKLIENKTKVIKELETYKKSLIYEYVTGKKEV